MTVSLGPPTNDFQSSAKIDTEHQAWTTGKYMIEWDTSRRLCGSEIKGEQKHEKKERMRCSFKLEHPPEISRISSGGGSLKEGGPILANVD